MTDNPPGPGASPTRLSPNALERRVKRWLLKGPFDCFIQVVPGLEETLVGELRAEGFVVADELHATRGGIELRLDHEGIMRANLMLRTAGRVMLRLGSFPASNKEMLYDRARKIAWEVQLGHATGYRLRVTAKNSKLQAGDEVINAVSGAIERHMRELGLYPKLSDDAPLEFHVRLLDDRCTISLNTSGEHLHRRGVRTHVGVAPLRETLAAAMVLEGLVLEGLVLEGLRPEGLVPEGLRGGELAAAEPAGRFDVILDPFCGSGTILIEAADLLMGLPPGRHRGFAFQQAAWFRPGRWREVQRVAGERQGVAGSPYRAAPPRVVGLDDDPAALAAARANLAYADHPDVELVETDSTRVDYDGFGASSGLIVSNLPYGVRLGDRQQAEAVARRFLDRLSKAKGRWRAVFLAASAEPITQHRAFRTEWLRPTTNGGLSVVMIKGEAGLRDVQATGGDSAPKQGAGQS